MQESKLLLFGYHILLMLNIKLHIFFNNFIYKLIITQNNNMKTTKNITFLNGKVLNLKDDRYFNLDQVQLFLNIDMASERLAYKFYHNNTYYITKDDFLKLLSEMSFMDKYNTIANDVLNNKEFQSIFPYFSSLLRSFNLLSGYMSSIEYIKNRIEKFNLIYKKNGGVHPIDISLQKFESFVPLFVSHNYKFVLVESPLEYNDYLKYKNEIPNGYALILSYNDHCYFNIFAHVISKMQETQQS